MTQIFRIKLNGLNTNKIVCQKLKEHLMSVK